MFTTTRLVDGFSGHQSSQVLYLSAVTVEPAAVTGWTFEEAVAEDGLDGVQADGAGLRQTDL